jgi:hypothetical protein
VPDRPALGGSTLVDHDRGELVAAVLAATETAVAMLEHPVVVAAWSDPSVLDDLTVGELAAHLAQMIGALVVWLEAAAPNRSESTVLPPTEVYGRARLDPDEGLDGDVARTIRSWAADGAARGPAATANEARDHRGRLPTLLATAEADRLVSSAVIPGAAIELDDYLATRCVELVVHVDDLAASTGLPRPSPDECAVAIAVEALVAMCRARAGDLDVLLALARPSRSSPEVLRAL